MPARLRMASSSAYLTSVEVVTEMGLLPWRERMFVDETKNIFLQPSKQ
jgi:hypothetical protein